MATFEVTSPDGAKYQVTAPDDATQDQIMSYVQSQSKAAPSMASAPASPAQIPAIALGRSVDRLAAGLKQGTRAVLGDSAVNAIEGLGKTLGMADSSKLEQSQAGNEAAYSQLRQQYPKTTFASDVLASAPARTPLGFALLGGLEYGTPEERALRAGTGYLGGKVGEKIAQGVGRMVNPVRMADPIASTETQALAQNAGVTLTPAQATGSKALAGLEGTLAQLPGSAGTMATIQQAQREAFNRKAMGMLGETTSNISNDATQIAKNNIGARFEQASKGVSIPVSDQLVNDLAQVESKYAKNLSPDQKPIVAQYMDDILNQAPNISGDAYQAWRSRIGARSASTQDSELKGALKGIQGALDNAFARGAPEAQSQLMQQARGQWRNLKTLEPLIEKAAMTSSNIPPAQVMSRALATKNTQGEMQGLAQLGQTIGHEYPNSGTVPRLFWQSLLQNPLTLLRPDFLLGATGGPMAAAKAYNSAPVRSYLTKGLLSISPEDEKLLKKLGGLLGGGSALGVQ